jgi:hypothetical protein
MLQPQIRRDADDTTALVSRKFARGAAAVDRLDAAKLNEGSFIYLTPMCED